MKDCLEKITQRVDEVLTLLAVERERADRLQDELHEAHTLCQMQKNSEEGYSRAVAMTLQELETERAEHAKLRELLDNLYQSLKNSGGEGYHIAAVSYSIREQRDEARVQLAAVRERLDRAINLLRERCIHIGEGRKYGICYEEEWCSLCGRALRRGLIQDSSNDVRWYPLPDSLAKELGSLGHRPECLLTVLGEAEEG